MKKPLKIVNYAAAGLVAALVLTANVLALGTFRETLQTFVFGYKHDAAAVEQNRASGAKLAKELVEEGTVLVRNKDNILPLDKTTNKEVNVFGWSSVAWIPGGSGSGRVVDPDNTGNYKTKVGLVEALNNYVCLQNAIPTSLPCSMSQRTRPSAGYRSWI